MIRGSWRSQLLDVLEDGGTLQQAAANQHPGCGLHHCILGLHPYQNRERLPANPCIIVPIVEIVFQLRSHGESPAKAGSQTHCPPRTPGNEGRGAAKRGNQRAGPLPDG